MISSRPARTRRTRGAAVVALAGACLLGACSGAGDGPAEGPGASGTASADTGGGSGAPASPAGPLEGTWVATTGGKAMALVVTGERAGLFATGGTVCSGTAGERAGTRTIRLTCTDGSQDRTTGTVRAVTGTTLEVDWGGGPGTETYTKAEGGRLPSGLPTAGLGS
ncbi:hypothetical protein ACIF8T_29530 [Streptomyces sp. NPDC085946]|uniref:hypothetical protein n=1 Tax=Streptomyces sp. NPDC085946 TaxID=3365744 RepID=UPI0037D2914D